MTPFLLEKGSHLYGCGGDGGDAKTGRLEWRLGGRGARLGINGRVGGFLMIIFINYSFRNDIELPQSVHLAA